MPRPRLLSELVETSRGVGEHASRHSKIARIAEFLRGLAADEIDIGVSYLSGATRQGRSGVGYALVRDARPSAYAETPALTLIEVDQTLQRIARSSGRGSIGERTALLSSLFATATEDEQSFLARLLLGELRQGALEGLMIEAVAAAADLPAASVRRAAMVAGGIARVAAPALTEGAAALERFTVALFQPLAPMLAQPADDIADAMARIPMAALRMEARRRARAGAQERRRGSHLHALATTSPRAAPEIVSTVQGAASADADFSTARPSFSGVTDRPTPFRIRCAASGACSTSRRMRKTMPLSVLLLRLPASE